jgi:hypothetical protein
MPKKKSSRPAASLGSNQNEEPKFAGQIRREKVIRAGAIVIVLALLLSLLAGAFSATPAQAAGNSNDAGFSKSVQKSYKAYSAGNQAIDTDGDGLPNNEDPDIDGDGVVNVDDNDIDGDGTSNFDDGDPAATNGFEGKTPSKPGGFTFDELAENGLSGWLILGLILVVAASIAFGFKIQQKRGQNPQKNL